MSAIKATIRDGRVEPAEPLNLPDGTEVRITVPEPDEPMGQAEIDRALEAMDRMEPLRMSDAELAAWERDREARKAWDRAHFVEHAERLRKMWE